ncbi:hypothetical protein BH10PSE12_BH10PSE12_27910 [soil metagenome]
MLRVHAICYYRDEDAGWPAAWRRSDLQAHDLIEALRRNEPQGLYEFPRGVGRQATPSDIYDGTTTAMDYASRMLAKAIIAAGYDAATVIPIPSTTHTRPGSDFLGRRIAKAIEDRNPRFRNTPVLYFARPLPGRAQGGGRTPTAIRINLRSTSLRGLHRAILIDDVATTGAHLKAAAAYLWEKGVRVEDAFVVARVAPRPMDNMFDVPITRIKL